jgi:hypothetical protein
VPAGASADPVAVPAELRALARGRAALAARGAAPASRGLEHVALAAPPGGEAAPNAVAEADRRVVEVYYRARFGGALPGPDELRRLRDGSGE